MHYLHNIRRIAEIISPNNLITIKANHPFPDHSEAVKMLAPDSASLCFHFAPILPITMPTPKISNLLEPGTEQPCTTVWNNTFPFSIPSSFSPKFFLIPHSHQPAQLRIGSVRKRKTVSRVEKRLSLWGVPGNRRSQHPAAARVEPASNGKPNNNGDDDGARRDTDQKTGTENSNEN